MSLKSMKFLLDPLIFMYYFKFILFVYSSISKIWELEDLLAIPLRGSNFNIFKLRDLFQKRKKIEWGHFRDDEVHHEHTPIKLQKPR